MSVPVLLFVLSVVAYLAFIVYSAKRAATDLDAPPSDDPGPLVSYGACCSPEGCRDYKDVDLEVAKADCEMSGGVFKAFSACADGPCPEAEKPKASAKKSKPAKKSVKPKEAPRSSMNVARKNAKKSQRKKRDF